MKKNMIYTLFVSLVLTSWCLATENPKEDIPKDPIKCRVDESQKPVDIVKSLLEDLNTKKSDDLLKRLSKYSYEQLSEFRRLARALYNTKISEVFNDFVLQLLESKENLPVKEVSKDSDDGVISILKDCREYDKYKFQGKFLINLLSAIKETDSLFSKIKNLRMEEKKELAQRRDALITLPLNGGVKKKKLVINRETYSPFYSINIKIIKHKAESIFEEAFVPCFFKSLQEFPRSNVFEVYGTQYTFSVLARVFIEHLEKVGIKFTPPYNAKIIEKEQDLFLETFNPQKKQQAKDSQTFLKNDDWMETSKKQKKQKKKGVKNKKNSKMKPGKVKDDEIWEEDSSNSPEISDGEKDEESESQKKENLVKKEEVKEIESKEQSRMSQKVEKSGQQKYLKHTPSNQNQSFEHYQNIRDLELKIAILEVKNKDLFKKLERLQTIKRELSGANSNLFVENEKLRLKNVDLKQKISQFEPQKNKVLKQESTRKEVIKSSGQMDVNGQKTDQSHPLDQKFVQKVQPQKHQLHDVIQKHNEQELKMMPLEEQKKKLYEENKDFENKCNDYEEINAKFNNSNSNLIVENEKLRIENAQLEQKVRELGKSSF